MKKQITLLMTSLLMLIASYAYANPNDEEQRLAAIRECINDCTNNSNLMNTCMMICGPCAQVDACKLLEFNCYQAYISCHQKAQQNLQENPLRLNDSIRWSMYEKEKEECEFKYGKYSNCKEREIKIAKNKQDCYQTRNSIFKACEMEVRSREDFQQIQKMSECAYICEKTHPVDIIDRRDCIQSCGWQK